MAFGVGLISGILIYKKSPNYLTRLQKLQKRQKQKPSSKITLREYPLKPMLSILLLIAFMIGLQFFRRQCAAELFEIWSKQSKFKEEVRVDSQEQQIRLAALTTMYNTLTESQDDNKHLDRNGQSMIISVTEDQSFAQFESRSLLDYDKLTIKIDVVVIVMIIAVVLSQNAKCVVLTAEKKSKSITIQKYWLGFLRLKGQNVITIKPNQEIRIYEIKQQGTNQSSKCSYQYVIKLLTSKEVREKEVTEIEGCVDVFKKESIFHAREAAILLTSVLGLAYVKKIHKIIA